MLPGVSSEQPGETREELSDSLQSLTAGEEVVYPVLVSGLQVTPGHCTSYCSPIVPVTGLLFTSKIRYREQESGKSCHNGVFLVGSFTITLKSKTKFV